MARGLQDKPATICDHIRIVLTLAHFLPHIRDSSSNWPASGTLRVAPSRTADVRRPRSLVSSGVFSSLLFSDSDLQKEVTAMPKPSLCYFCDKPCEGSYNGTPTCWACWPVEQAKPVSTPSPADLPARKAPTTFADVVNEAIAPADVACQWPDCDCTCPEDSECVNYNACKGLPATRQCGIKGCNCMGLDPITPAAGLSYDVLRLHADGSTTVETHRIAQGP